MNRTKRPLTKKQRRAVKKAIRLAQAPQPKSPSLKTDKLAASLKERQKKVSPKDATTVDNFRKRMAAKKLKKSPKVSKRTNPGVDLESPPQIVHIEGRRWLKTLVKQNVQNRKILTKRLSKAKRVS